MSIEHRGARDAAPPPSSARPRRRLLRWGVPLLIAAAGLLAWRQPWHAGPAAPSGSPGAPGFPGPPGGVQTVTLAEVTTGDMPIEVSGLGTVTPLATVTVRSQLSGYLTAVNFREGELVRKGDVLAQLDPRPYDATLLQYQGQLQKDQALLRGARLDVIRYQKLAAQDSVARQTLDTALATAGQYEGAVKSDQGQIDAQRVNLEYTRITAPIDGRVGLRQVDAGNYVTASDTNGIVVLTQVQPISVVFTVSEDSLPQILRRLRAGATLTVAAYDRANQERLATGTLQTVDNQIDTATGTVKLRAIFDNKDQELFPNQFVNVRLRVDTLRGATLMPAAAVQQGTPGSFVYRLGAGNKVAVAVVATGASDAANVVVRSGVAPGAQVVVDGADRLKDGASVRPVTPAGAR